MNSGNVFNSSAGTCLIPGIKLVLQLPLDFVITASFALIKVPVTYNHSTRPQKATVTGTLMLHRIQDTNRKLALNYILVWNNHNKIFTAGKTFQLHNKSSSTGAGGEVPTCCATLH